MNLVVLSAIAALVLFFGLRYVGRLMAAVLGDGEYNTGAMGKASWAQSTLWTASRLGTLGTPLALAGAAFGVGYGWAPVFLWILLTTTTAAAFMLAARNTPGPARAGSLAIDRSQQLVVAAALALLWAAIAATQPDALIGFGILYLAAQPINRWLTKGPLEQAIGVLGVIALAFVLAVAGRLLPIAVHGPIHWAAGPWHVTTGSGALVFYAAFCVLLLRRGRRRNLAPYPPTGTIGIIILVLVATGALTGALVHHPTLVVPRLPAHGIMSALPLIATALPFGAALAPLGQNQMGAPSLTARHALSIGEGAAAIIVMMGALSAWSTRGAWQRFYAAHPGPAELLGMAGRGLGVLGQALDLTVLTPLFSLSLLLLIAAAFESIQYQLGQGALATEALRGGRSLAGTAALGALLWFALHAGMTNLVLGALLGLGGVGALTSRSHQLPPFVVSLSLVLLVPIDIALGVIGWGGPLYSPTAAGVMIVFMIEAAWIIWLWRTGSRFTDYAARRLRN